jgi:hypothetical protein
MRCRRWPRVSAYQDTPRKRAALARTQHIEREELPLLRALIAEQQLSADAEMARRAAWWPRVQQEARDRRAQDWRRARRHLAGYGNTLRQALLQLWRDCPYPADPTYLLDLLHGIEAGRVDPARPPWQYPAALAPRTTPQPVSFDAAFRRIGARKVGGGPKLALGPANGRTRGSTGADAFTFVGNLGRGILFLTSRVRLIEPNESFYTSSNHRLRDSHVGRSGHWVDIQVHGLCSDAELALIERLAQAVDDRPVVVRRARQAAAVSISAPKSVD